MNNSREDGLELIEAIDNSRGDELHRVGSAVGSSPLGLMLSAKDPSVLVRQVAARNYLTPVHELLELCVDENERVRTIADETREMRALMDEAQQSESRPLLEWLRIRWKRLSFELVAVSVLACLAAALAISSVTARHRTEMEAVVGQQQRLAKELESTAKPQRVEFYASTSGATAYSAVGRAVQESVAPADNLTIQLAGSTAVDNARAVSRSTEPAFGLVESKTIQDLGDAGTSIRTLATLYTEALLVLVACDKLPDELKLPPAKSGGFGCALQSVTSEAGRRILRHAMEHPATFSAGTSSAGAHEYLPWLTQRLGLSSYDRSKTTLMSISEAFKKLASPGDALSVVVSVTGDIPALRDGDAFRSKVGVLTVPPDELLDQEASNLRLVPTTVEYEGVRLQTVGTVAQLVHNDAAKQYVRSFMATLCSARSKTSLLESISFTDDFSGVAGSVAACRNLAYVTANTEPTPAQEQDQAQPL